MSAPRKRCPSCGQDVRLKGDGAWTCFYRHYLNPIGYTTPHDRGDRCINSDWPVHAAYAPDQNGLLHDIRQMTLLEDGTYHWAGLS